MRSTRRRITIVVALLATSLIAASSAEAVASAQQGAANDPTAIEGEFLGPSEPVRTLERSGATTPTGTVQPRINPLAGGPNSGKRGTWNRESVPPDPLASGSQSAGSRTPAPGLVFDGTANPFACSGCSPPDTVGDVGPNHYVQAVNATKIAIYDKSGNLLTPAFDLGTLFSTSPCTSNAGDPNVTYDPIADRWVLSQFAVPTHLCFAVSQTANPLGSYYLYQFDVGAFPDYFKVGAWPSGYYVSSNEASYTAYVFDRVNMLAGNAATAQKFLGESNFMLPADVDGSNPPGPNEGGLFDTFKDSAFHGGANDRIELFRLNPDFGTPANSTFGLVDSFPIAPFTYTVCGFFNFNCIPQSGTAQTVDTVSEWPMHRFPYREFSDHQALVGNFTVGGGSATPGAAIRWFELRNTGSGWTLFQEGTHDPGGGLNRFMGSIAIDSGGDIALGYSASSATSFPSIRYATRTPGDPPGTLGAEQVMQAGGGSQTGSNRWGDYSAMSVDPVTECDFWYTNQYYSASSATSWKTAIGTFLDPSCLPDTTIDSGPTGVIRDNTPTFTFSSDKAGSTFECRIDSDPFAGCSGPGDSDTTAALLDGPHTFAVRASDAASNLDPSPATRAFTVDTKVEGSASAKGKQKQKGKKIIVKAKVGANEDLDAKASGKVKLGKKSYKLKPASKSVSSGKQKNLKLKPKKSKDAKKIAKALKQGKKAKAKLTVKLTDEAGNKKTEKLSVRLKR